jgi:hypothetical protein
VDRMSTQIARRAPDGLILTGTQKIDMEPARKGDVVLLSWVDEAEIPEAHRAYVRRHTDRAARRLGLEPIAIRWFGAPTSTSRRHCDDCPPGDFTGVAREDDTIPAGVTPYPTFPMTIALNAGLRGSAVKAVVAHEVRHVAQCEARRRLNDAHEREADADSFAAAYIDQEPD